MSSYNKLSDIPAGIFDYNLISWCLVPGKSISKSCNGHIVLFWMTKGGFNSTINYKGFFSFVVSGIHKKPWMSKQM